MWARPPIRKSSPRNWATINTRCSRICGKPFRLCKTRQPAGLRVEDLPPNLRDRFVGVTGKQLLQVYPKEDVWQRNHREEFIRQLRTVDPDVTGTPVQLLEYTSLLKVQL